MDVVGFERLFNGLVQKLDDVAYIKRVACIKWVAFIKRFAHIKPSLFQICLGVSIALDLGELPTVTLLLVGCCPTAVVTCMLAVIQQAHVELAVVLLHLQTITTLGKEFVRILRLTHRPRCTRPFAFVKASERAKISQRASE